jgi:hypothetical protein
MTRTEAEGARRKKKRKKKRKKVVGLTIADSSSERSATRVDRPEPARSSPKASERDYVKEVARAAAEVAPVVRRPGWSSSGAASSEEGSTSAREKKVRSACMRP